MESLGFAQCLRNLTAVATTLNKFQEHQTQIVTLWNLWTMSKWPVKTEELLSLLQRIERHKSIINLSAISNNRYYTHVLTHSRNTKNSDWQVSDNAFSLLGKSNSAPKLVCDLQDDGLQKRLEERGMSLRLPRLPVNFPLKDSTVVYRGMVLEWLSPYNHNTQHAEISRHVKDKTNLWFLNAPTFRNWLTSTEETSPILWCPGIRKLFKAVPAAIRCLSHIAND